MALQKSKEFSDFDHISSYKNYNLGFYILKLSKLTKQRLKKKPIVTQVVINKFIHFPFIDVSSVV